MTIQILSRARLADFADCPRRFQLRYVSQLPWPAGPLDVDKEEARALGQRFHQVLHRHFLGLPVETEAGAEPVLHRWWDQFVQQGPALPPGHRLPELTLTVPLRRHLLTGRFDLLILGEDAAHIFDWKTEASARPAGKLRDDLQTRLYLALAAEGMPAIGRPVAPEHIHLTYWYVNEPEKSVTLDYSQGWHTENWAALEKTAAGIDRLLAAGDGFPKTGDWDHCRRCAYQYLCGRGTDAPILDDWLADELPLHLEPDLP